MKLYGNGTSPFVRHCQIRLEQSGFEYELIKADSGDITDISPTMRIPYFVDGSLELCDSSSILAYIAEKQNRPMFTGYSDADLFASASTMLDASINRFILAKEGINSETSGYMKRQENRILALLNKLDKEPIDTSQGFSEGALRLACYLDWALFRDQIDGLDKFPNLSAVLASAKQWDLFSQTEPSE